ncbi:MAG: TIGR04219 family outer membrane beta-barrel protein [Aquificota bacterium]|nr:TIGR04219 family outer membrane beta-barrel protein [Aquificota bacterium]
MRRHALLVGAVLTAGTVYGVSFEASVGAMGQNPSGYVQYPANTGTRADLENTLGLGGETRFFARAKIEIPVVPNLYLQYIPMSFKGRGTLTQTVVFGGRTFTVNTDVETSVRIDHIDAGLYYNIPVPGGVLDPELGINVRVIDFKGRITDLNNNVTEEKSATFPVPMVYGGIGVNLGMFALVGEFRGITYAGNSYYDITGEVRVKPFPKVFLGAGYRYERLRIDDVSDVDADIEISGPFGVVGVAF